MRCHYCDAPLTPKTRTVDHKVPRAAGGTNDPNNLLASCFRCNVAKGVYPYEMFISLLKAKGIPWRNKEYGKQMASFKKQSKGEKLERKRGVSNPLIGQRFKVRALLRKQREMRSKVDGEGR